MPMIYLYTEVLANIRQANLYASLRTHKNEHTKIEIASDKKTITVSHDGETASIYLPTEISGTAEVNIPVDRGKEMTVRLELADIKNMPSLENTIGHEQPWGANDLSPNAHLRCRVCEAELLNNEVPLQFKDLPNESWAEMMDFWHCHRPQHAASRQGEDAEEAADSKGYGSHTRLKATPGVAFVDTAYFLFAEQDCRNIQRKPYLTKYPMHPGQQEGGLFSNRQRYHVQAADTIAQNQVVGLIIKAEVSSVFGRWILGLSSFIKPLSFSATFSLVLDCAGYTENYTSKLCCYSCNAQLGYVSAEGWRIHKSSLSLKARSDAEWETFLPDIFISSQLLALIDSSAARKFVVHPEDTNDGLLIWVFNPDIRYSSSRRSEPVVRALKIFYQETSDAQKLLDDHQASLQELPLPRYLFESLKSALLKSTALLPPCSRKFQDWTIGLIDRYERKTSEGLKYFENVASSIIDRAAD